VIYSASSNLVRHISRIAEDRMVAPVVAAGRRPAVPLVLPVISGILHAIFCEDVVVEQIPNTVHQIGARDLIIIYVILGDVTVFGVTHAQAKTAVLTQDISCEVQKARGLNIDSLAVS